MSSISCASGRCDENRSLPSNDKGERFFRNDVSFEHPFRADFRAGPGLDLEPKRDHHGDLLEEPGLVSLFEDPKGTNGVEGSTMMAVFVAPGTPVEMMTDHLNCRVLACATNSFTYYAGASWSLTGEIMTPEAWHRHVRQAQAMKAASFPTAK